MVNFIYHHRVWNVLQVFYEGVDTNDPSIHKDAVRRGTEFFGGKYSWITDVTSRVTEDSRYVVVLIMHG